MKYAIVPQEPTESGAMLAAADETVAAEQLWTPGRIYRAMLAARPPLDADMQAALKVARDLLAIQAQGYMTLTMDETLVYRQFLRAAGEDV